MKKIVILIIVVGLALVFGFLFAVSMKQVGKIASNARDMIQSAPVTAQMPAMPGLAGMQGAQIPRPADEPQAQAMPTQAALPMTMPMPIMIGADIVSSPAIMEALQDPEKRALFLQEARRQNMGESEEAKKIINRLQENIMLGELFKKESITQVQINDEELKEYFKSHEQEFKLPGSPGFESIKELVRIRMTEELQRKKINSLIEKIKKESSQ